MKASVRSVLYSLLLSLILLAAAGCADPAASADDVHTQAASEEANAASSESSISTADTSDTGEDSADSSDADETAAESSEESTLICEEGFDLSQIPEYSEEAYVEINGNEPYFTEEELTASSYESYSDLDPLGRCGVAEACIGTDLMPTEERGSIGSVRPSGWHTVKYDGIDGNYLYNRCHLIGYQLSGENANEENLITGTRYLNVEGMLPFENEVADYVEETGNHVMYRVTPVFEGENLVASGVLMEAYSVEDDGEGISFCVYCYNVQPGIEIDYETGDSEGPEYTGSDSAESESEAGASASGDSGTSSADSASDDSAAESEETSDTASEDAIDIIDTSDDPASVTYIGNANTMKFHDPDCSSVDDMAEHNKVYFYGSRDEVTAAGYSPCKICSP